MSRPLLMSRSLWMIMSLILIQAIPAWSQTCPLKPPDTLSLVNEICRPMGLPTRLVMAVIQVESAGNPNAINVTASGNYSIFPPSQSEAASLLKSLQSYTSDFGIGLMQIHYSYHGGRYGVTPTQLLDPRVNITIGCGILKLGLRKPGNIVQRIGRYNASTRHKQVAYASKILNALGGK